MIEVQELSEDTFRVTVSDATTTHHEVEVPSEYWQELTGGSISREELVRRSFEFLLEREPNTSILSSFAISSINRYFPEYEREMRDRIQGG